MAESAHVELIKEGSNTWNYWRRGNPDIVPDLAGANLTDINLRRANLSEANLDGANLRGTDLSEADLSDASLVAAQLIEANLDKASLRRANLRQALFYKASLQGASFGGAFLRGANLRMANLIGANFSEADLFLVDFSGADLAHASLRRASLHGTILYGANLYGANLVGADLTAANFVSADLSDANLEWAHMSNTVLANNDLSTVKGLESVTHRGPSSIGVDTLYKSQGKIPEVFLRGIGLQEGLITYLPSLMSQPIQFYSCFISYSRADKSFARRLHDSLQGRGIRCWLDEHELLPGDKIYTEVDRAIRLWDKVLLCCSKEALTSWWVDNEIKIAFEKEQHLWQERKKEVLALIPLTLDDYLFSNWQSGLATEVKARMAANFTGWQNDNQHFEDQFERLVKALRTNRGGKEPPPLPLL